ncbi:MAG TPA: hypothetical protein PLF42_15765, partial [Anaerolineales bacterium]|nr:hypothetical protein [Anaerolineales bacterium]
MKTKPIKLWLTVLALGWLFDFLFWNKGFGINFAVFWTIGLIAVFHLLLSDGLRPHRSSLVLIPLFGFFAAVTFLRAEPMTTFLAVTFTLLTLTILTVTYLGGRWMQYSLADYFAKALSLAGSVLARPITFTSEARKVQEELGKPPAKYNLMPLLRGMLIALP